MESGTDTAQTIKSHQRKLKTCSLNWLEPLNTLYKDEVRASVQSLYAVTIGANYSSGPGLAIRAVKLKKNLKQSANQTLSFRRNRYRPTISAILHWHYWLFSRGYGWRSYFTTIISSIRAITSSITTVDLWNILKFSKNLSSYRTKLTTLTASSTILRANHLQLLRSKIIRVTLRNLNLHRICFKLS